MWNETEVIDIENYCSECGTKIRPKARFCEGCGKKIQTSDEIKEQFIKEIEQEVRTNPKKELLAEFQTENACQMQEEKERKLHKNKSTKNIVLYKKGDWKYVIIILGAIFGAFLLFDLVIFILSSVFR
jgi:uncharacterized membrane protein YvbJ